MWNNGLTHLVAKVFADFTDHIARKFGAGVEHGANNGAHTQAWVEITADEVDVAKQLTQTLGTPGRTLPQGFVETFGTTPMAYLRTLRLSNARHDLLTQRWATGSAWALSRGAHMSRS